jgi:hypothetical protein
MQPMMASPMMVDHGIQRIQSLFPNVMTKLAGKGNSFGPDRTIIPRSIFYGIFEDYEKLLETHNNLMDADWLASHPPLILATEVPKVIPADQIDENTAYDHESLFEASGYLRREQRRETVAEINRLLTAQNGHRRFGKKEQTIREMQLEYYRRPDQTDKPLPLDPYVSVAHAPAPTVVNDYDFQRKLYYETIHSAMGLGGDSFLSAAQWTAKKTGTAKGSALSSLPDGSAENNSSEGLELLLQGEMSIVSQIFEQVRNIMLLLAFFW